MTEPGRIRFEWDNRKAETNKRKHEIGFPLATQVFNDPLVKHRIEGDENGEVRWQAIGQVGRVLIRVTYTTYEEDESEVFRIISARELTPRERRTHERNSEDDG